VSTRGFVLVAALMMPPACASTYAARQAPLGDPAWPAAHVDGVCPQERYEPPGWYLSSSASHDQTAVVTRAEGFRVRHTSSVQGFGIRWDIRLQGGAGTDVLSMMWSPASAPRCQGGHPALDILLDLDAPPNSVLAPRRQVHWERPVVVRGERVISGRFDRDPDLLRRASVVDLQVVQHMGTTTREVCVRVPVNGPGVTY
jgi:hypothetical protein